MAYPNEPQNPYVNPNNPRSPLDYDRVPRGTIGVGGLVIGAAIVLLLILGFVFSADDDGIGTQPSVQPSITAPAEDSAAPAPIAPDADTAAPVAPAPGN